MAKNKAAELRELDLAELQLRAAETQKEMFDLRLRLATKEQSASRTLRTKKRYYARLLTVIGEKAAK